MIIGILADSHDNLPKLQKAVALFNKKNTCLVLHAGDYIAPFALGMLEKHLRCEYRGVYGNNDGEREGLRALSNGKISSETVELQECGKKIFLIHDLSKTRLNVASYDIVISGHTHDVDVNKRNQTWFINPGECGGWLRGCSSVVTFDIIADTVKVHRL